MKKIVFFVQTKKPIGGSQIQFLNFAAFIAQHYKYDVYYINHRNPQVEQTYRGFNIHFVDVDKCDYSQFEDALFFTPVNYIYYLLVKVQNLQNAKILLYFYHPNVLDWLNVQVLLKNRPYQDELLSLIEKTNAYCFMDSSNYFAMKRRTDIPLKPVYLPVTLGIAPSDARRRIPLCSEKEINIGWMGRLDNDKIYSIINAADNIMKYETDKRINFHIIGDGNAKNKISIKGYSPNIRFIFTSYLYDKARDKYVKENIDLMVAMGLSAVDSAMLNVPTLIPIVSPKRFWTDKFVYVQDLDGYSLGWEIQDLGDLGCKTCTIGEALDDIYVSGRKEELGPVGHDFCAETFSLARASENLVNLLEKSELTVSKCLECRAVAIQMKSYSRYKKLRPNRDYAVYHEFVAWLNRLKEKTLLQKFGLLYKKICRAIFKERIK